MPTLDEVSKDRISPWRLKELQNAIISQLRLDPSEEDAESIMFLTRAVICGTIFLLGTSKYPEINLDILLKDVYEQTDEVFKAGE